MKLANQKHYKAYSTHRANILLQHMGNMLSFKQHMVLSLTEVKGTFISEDASNGLFDLIISNSHLRYQ